MRFGDGGVGEEESVGEGDGDLRFVFCATGFGGWASHEEGAVGAPLEVKVGKGWAGGGAVGGLRAEGVEGAPREDGGGEFQEGFPVTDGADADLCEVVIGEVWEEVIGDGVGIESGDVDLEAEFAEEIMDRGGGLFGATCCAVFCGGVDGGLAVAARGHGRDRAIHVRGDGLSVEGLRSWWEDLGMSNETALADLLTFLRFPSVSTDPMRAGSVRECGQWLRDHLVAGGFRAELHETQGHPIVLAHGPVKLGRPTVLIYGHYDVQPEVPVAEWDTPPFEPVIREGRIHARGATDNKGQIFAHVSGAIAALRESGDLPVNLIFLVEGEEEIGSGNLEPFLVRHREALRCDVIAVSDTGMVAEGVPTLTCGLRGIAAMEVRVKGPKVDLHSGIYGGAVRNPITALARLMSTLHDGSGRVAVEGFYDGVEEVPGSLREAWGRLPLNEKVLLEITGSPSLEGEAGYSALERVWARPTAEINGIGGGFQGAGSKTVIPREAFAKLTFRLVPGQDPERVLGLVRKHLEARVEAGVELEVEIGHTGMPYLVDSDGKHARAAIRALGETFEGADVAVIREGGSIPIITSFKRVLGVDTLLLGLALPDCNAHAPNETFPVANFEAGIRLNGALLRALAVG